MSRERCIICNFHGKISHEVTVNYLYQTSSVQTVLLCYGHSVEFFKIGQTNFLLKYKEGFNEHGLDTAKFFDTKNPYQFFSFR